MNALNRETTIANRFPAPLSLPSIAATAGLGGRSELIFFFRDFLRDSGVSVVNAVCLCVPSGEAFDFTYPETARAAFPKTPPSLPPYP
jgi:hypothetical protein